MCLIEAVDVERLLQAKQEALISVGGLDRAGRLPSDLQYFRALNSRSPLPSPMISPAVCPLPKVHLQKPLISAPA